MADSEPRPPRRPPPAAEGGKPSLPWLGLRARLSAAFDCASLTSPAAKTICAALKKYGVILADVGSPWWATHVHMHTRTHAHTQANTHAHMAREAAEPVSGCAWARLVALSARAQGTNV